MYRSLSHGRILVLTVRYTSSNGTVCKIIKPINPKFLLYSWNCYWQHTVLSGRRNSMAWQAASSSMAMTRSTLATTWRAFRAEYPPIETLIIKNKLKYITIKAQFIKRKRTDPQFRRWSRANQRCWDGKDICSPKRGQPPCSGQSWNQNWDRLRGPERPVTHSRQDSPTARFGARS